MWLNQRRIAPMDYVIKFAIVNIATALLMSAKARDLNPLPFTPLFFTHPTSNRI